MVPRGRRIPFTGSICPRFESFGRGGGAFPSGYLMPLAIPCRPMDDGVGFLVARMLSARRWGVVA
mgnify:FL=1